MAKTEISLQTTRSLTQYTIDSSFEGFDVSFDDTILTNQILELYLICTDFVTDLYITLKNLQGAVLHNEKISLNIKGEVIVKVLMDKTITGIRYNFFLNRSIVEATTTTLPIEDIPPAMDSNIATYNFNIPLFKTSNSTYIASTYMIDGAAFLTNLKQKRLNFTIDPSNITQNAPNDDCTLNTNLSNMGATLYDLTLRGGRINTQTTSVEDLSGVNPYNTDPFNFTAPPANTYSVSVASGEYQAQSIYDSNHIFYFVKRPTRVNISEMTSTIIINIFISFVSDVTDDYIFYRNISGEFFISVTNPLNPLVQIRIIFINSNYDVSILDVPQKNSVLFYHFFDWINASEYYLPLATYSNNEPVVFNTPAKRAVMLLHKFFSYFFLLNYELQKIKKVYKYTMSTPCYFFSELCANASQYYLSSIADSVKKNEFVSQRMEKIKKSYIISQSSENSHFLPPYFTINGKKYTFVFEYGQSYQQTAGYMSVADVIGDAKNLPTFKHHRCGFRSGSTAGTYKFPLYQSFFEKNHPTLTNDPTLRYAHFMNKGLLSGTSISSIGLNSIPTILNSGIGLNDPINFAHYRFFNPEDQVDTFFTLIHNADSNMSLYSPIVDVNTPMIQTGNWVEICYNYYLLFDNITNHTFVINPTSTNFAPNLNKYSITTAQKIRMFRLRFVPWENIMGTKNANDIIWNSWFSRTESLAITYTADGKVSIGVNTKFLTLLN
jgi:hypothetical protein